jgi:LPS-assembly lipoprotein
MRRRTLMAAAALAPLLGGCGFALRRPGPLAFQRLALVGFPPASNVAQSLRRALPQDVSVVDAPAQSQVVLESLLERREKGIVATTIYGQVREMQLRVRFRYRLSTRAGQPLVGPTDLLLFRDLSFSETIALAKEQEQNELYRAMEDDIALQVLRRLEAVREV